MIKYRAVIKVGYCEAWFEFENVEEACKFAGTALTHMVLNEDNKKKESINIWLVDTEGEADAEKR